MSRRWATLFGRTVLLEGMARPLAFALLVGWWTCVPATTQAQTTITKSIAASTDDAEEAGPDATGSHPPGFMDLTSSDIELVTDNDAAAGYSGGTQKIGLRFTAMTIPAGATITSAYLTFRAVAADAPNSNSGAASLTIKAQLTANATTFPSTISNISSRTLTTASALWSPTSWTTGTDYNSTSIVSVIQEVVNQGAWASGNAIAIIVTGTGHRSAQSYDSAPATSAKLVVTYTVAPIWDGGGANNNWSTATNWVADTVPVNNGTAPIVFAGSTRLSPNTDVNWDVLGITFSNNASAFTLGGNQITVQGGGFTNNSASLQTISNNLVLGASHNWNAASGGLTLGGTISGTGGPTKLGTGTLILSGGSANTYSGGSTLSAGTLDSQKVSGLSSNNVTLSGGTLRISTVDQTYNQIFTVSSASTIDVATSRTFTLGNGANDLTGAGALTKTGAGRLVLTNANNHSGGVSINAGQVTIGADTALGTGPLTLNGGTLFASGTRTLANILSVTANSTLGSSNSDDFFFSSGNISGSSGVTLTLTNATATPTMVMNLSGSSYTFASDIRLEDWTRVRVRNSSGTNTFTGVISGTGDDTSGTSGGVEVYVAGGTTLLSGLNTFSSRVMVLAGTLIIQNSSALGTTASGTAVSNGAALYLQGDISVGTEALNLTGTGVANGGALRSLSGNNSWAGAVSLAAASRINSDGGLLTLGGVLTNSSYALTVGGAGSVTLGGVVSGSGGLIKDGAGTATLSAANIYSGGTTVSNGTLKVNNSSGSGSGSGIVQVRAGATLMGSGTISGTVTNSGAISAGDGVGTLNTGAEIWNAASTNIWEMNQANGTKGGNPGWDWLNISGALTINGTTGSPVRIKITSLDSGGNPGQAANFSATQSNSWIIATASGGISGFASNIFLLDTNAFQNSLNGGSFTLFQSGNDLILGFIPFPSADVQTTKSGATNVTAGANLAYTITVTNLGPSSTTNLVVTDLIPTNATFVSATSGGTYNAGSGTVTWTPLTNFTANATTNFTITVTASASGSLTNTVSSSATTTDPDASNNDGSSSSAKVVTTVTPLTISGAVFEDANYGGGAGRSKASSSGTGQSGARVELFNGSGNFVTYTNTDGSGNYTLSGLTANSTNTVRVVNSSVTSSRSGYGASLLPVQTYRTIATNGTAAAVTDHVGGETPTKADAGNGSTTLAALTTGTATPQSISTVTLTTNVVTGVEFGFNFNTIVNTNDTGQGSLRQFVTNANALANAGLAQSGLTAGIDNALFMIADGTARAGMNTAFPNQFVSGIATIVPASALPVITDPVVLDATIQPGWSSAPILQLNGASAGAGVNGLRITVGSSTVRGFVINRFTDDGIELYGNSGNTVAGNYIGTDVTGHSSLANGASGIRVEASANNVIGGTAAGSRNVISGNSGHGVFLYGSSPGNQILGNYIGTDVDGVAPVGNAVHGVTLSAGASTNVIGGTTAAARNVISGNLIAGVRLASPTTSGNTIQGNFIGVDFTGVAALGNGSFGVIADSPNTIIGGTAANAGNVIAGNSSHGVYIDDEGAGSVIQGNYIGTDLAVALDLGNTGTGVYLNSASNVTVGGTAAGAANVIAYNTGDGVGVVGSVSGNVIRRNSIYANDQLGIDLVDNGVTPNDGTVGSGPNNGMDYPVFLSAALSNSVLYVSGFVGSASNQAAFANATIELFKADNSPANQNGEVLSGDGQSVAHGEGRTYLGTITADASGNFTTNLTVSGLAVGDAVAGTATDASGNSSEFGANATVTLPLADVRTTKTGAASVYATSNLTYTITVTNLGPAGASNVVVSDLLPTNVTFVSASSGGTNGNGTVWWPTMTNFAVSATTNFTVTITAPSSGSLTNTASSTTASTDPDASNNNGSASNAKVITTVTPIADVQTTKSGATNVTAGANLAYTITVTNLGPSSTTNLVVTDLIPTNATFVSATSGGTYNAGSGTVTWTPLTNFTANATTNFTITVTASASGSLTNTVSSSATTTDPDASNNDGSSSSAKVVTTVTPLTVSGSVFEDANYGGGAGRSKASSSGTGQSGARVELFNGSGNFVTYTNTDGSGNYTLSGLSANSTNTVRVVNSSVTSSRSGYGASLLAVQTYRTTATNGTAAAVTDHVGGETPNKADAGNGSTTLAALTTGTTTPQSISTVTLTTNVVTGVEFGFNFNTLVNTNDTGQGSLRQFVTNANALANAGLAQSGLTAGIDNAIFMIADGTARAGMNTGYANQFSSGVATIVPASALPVITDPVVLDATLQPGFSSAPIVQLTGTGAGAVDGFNITAGGSTVRGWVINWFNQSGIRITTAGGNTIQGNYIGTDATGTSAATNNQQGIYILSVSGNTIGGPTDAARNVISGNRLRGILVSGGGASTNVIQGNYIGLNAAGSAAVPNIIGIYLSAAPNNTIGGTAAGAGNYVSGNSQIGIYLVGSGTTGSSVQGNTVGLNVSSATVANGAQGIDIITGSANNTIGGTAAGAGNIISGNGLRGVRVTTGAGNLIQRNSIYANTSGGIELGLDAAVTPNDGTAGSGANNGMDYPVFTSAVLSGTTLFVAGYVGSAPGQSTFANATIEIFKADNSPADQNGEIISGDGQSVAHGEGRTYLGTITADASGNFNTSLTVAGLALTDTVTATATLAANGTSEFGANTGLLPPITVSGYAYLDANKNGFKDSTEAGTGLGLYAKIFATTNSSGPALQAATVNGASGAYSFTNVATGLYNIVLDDNATLSDVTSALAAGWTGTEMPAQFRTNVAVALVDVPNQNFGLNHALGISGRVFKDTGPGGGTANDGIVNGSETGLGGVTVKLTDSTGATTYDTAATDGSGNYTLHVPSTVTNGATLKIVEVNPPVHLSTGAGVGNTSGTYDRASDTITFTHTSGTTYSSVNFGDVPDNSFVNDGQLAGLPGTFVIYPHTFVAGSGGSVLFSVTNSPNPSIIGWSQVIYRDANCNGAFDPGEAVVNGALTVSAGDKICILIKELIPATAPFNAQDQLTVTAAFTWTGASPALSTNSTRIDLTTVGQPTSAGLTLLKSVDKETALPGEVLSYTVTYANKSSAALTNIVIFDQTPAFTTFTSATYGALPNSIASIAVSSPSVSGTGQIKWTFTGSLAPASSGTVTFSVTVAQ